MLYYVLIALTRSNFSFVFCNYRLFKCCKSNDAVVTSAPEPIVPVPNTDEVKKPAVVEDVSDDEITDKTTEETIEEVEEEEVESVTPKCEKSADPSVHTEEEEEQKRDDGTLEVKEKDAAFEKAAVASSYKCCGVGL